MGSSNSSSDSGPAKRVDTNESRAGNNFDLKRTLTATLAAVVGLVSSLAPGNALPVSTQETVEHAAALKSAPSPKQLPNLVDEIKKTKDEPYYGNLIEWNSANPNDAFLLCVHAWGLSAREFSSLARPCRAAVLILRLWSARFWQKSHAKGNEENQTATVHRDIGQIIAERRRATLIRRFFWSVNRWAEQWCSKSLPSIPDW